MADTGRLLVPRVGLNGAVLVATGVGQMHLQTGQIMLETFQILAGDGVDCSAIASSR